MKNLFVFLMILFIVPVHGQEPSSGKETTLKIMTYNIWNGFDWGKDLGRKEKLVQWINTQNPDVLALQELCGYTPELLEKDAKKWGHAYSILLKTDGYSVGLTSNKPIKLLEKVRTGMWHGMLHCSTYGIDFFVVHLSPADNKTRKREAAIIGEKVKAISNKNFVILGDFNALSPFDETALSQNKELLEKYRKGDRKPDNKYKNLINESFDYSVISSFLELPTIDVCLNFISPEKRFSFPTPALIKEYGRTADEIIAYRERIDYILASENLSKNCTEAIIVNDESTELLSDHFPVSSTFNLKLHK